MPHADFTSPTRGDPVSFDLVWTDPDTGAEVARETFNCLTRLPVGFQIDALAADNSMRGLGEFFDGVIIPAQAERFAEALRDRDRPVDLAQLQAIIRWLVEVYTGRPTGPPSASGNGRPTTGATSTDAAY